MLPPHAFLSSSLIGSENIVLSCCSLSYKGVPLCYPLLCFTPSSQPSTSSLAVKCPSPPTFPCPTRFPTLNMGRTGPRICLNMTPISTTPFGTLQAAYIPSPFLRAVPPPWPTIPLTHGLLYSIRI